MKLRDSYMDDIFVRTLYGPVPLKHALHWPIFASFNEVAGCAAWMGGRIPTAEEARSIYSYVDGLKLKDGDKIGKTVPAVNAYADSFPFYLPTTLPCTILPSYYSTMKGIGLRANLPKPPRKQRRRRKPATLRPLLRR